MKLAISKFSFLLEIIIIISLIKVQFIMTGIHYDGVRAKSCENIKDVNWQISERSSSK